MIDIIVYEKAGKGRGGKVLKQITEYANANGIEIAVHSTDRKGCAEELSADLSKAGAEKIAVIGGDGTFHEVLNGLDVESNTRVGFIAGGNGNDFVRGTDINFDPIDAFKDIVKGEHRNIDFLKVGSRRSLNVAGTGMDVSVLQRTYDKHNSVTYVASLAACLLSFKTIPFKVTSPEFETYEGKAIMVGACNGTQFGGGIKICPSSRADDGIIDVIIMEKPKHVPTLFVMPNFVKGKHLKKKYCRHIKCTQFSVETPVPVELDGEIYTDLKFDVSVAVGELKTFAPHSYKEEK